MSLESEIKEIEQKVYLYYNEDGLVDIVIGFVFLGWSVLLFVEPSALIALLGPIALAIWLLGKRFFTIPRIGIIRTSQKMENRLRNLSIALVVLGLLSLIAVMLGVIAENTVFVNYTLGILGLVIAAGICFLAFMTYTNRLYAYAILLFVAFAGGEALNEIVSLVDTFALSVMLAGVLILFSGLVILIRFLRRYPIPVEEA